MRQAWKPLVIVGGLLLLLTYLLLQSRSPDLVLRVRMHEALQAFQLHDAELTRDVLLARAGLLASYDSLPRTAQKLARAVDALRVETATLPHAVAWDIGPNVEALAAALQNKLTLVEHFTSDNALLRNSSTYVAHAGRLLGARDDDTVAAEVTSLAQAMLRFMQSPQPDARDAVVQALDRLSRVAGTRRDVRTLAAHGRLVVTLLPGVDDLLRQIVATGTDTSAEVLQTTVLYHADRLDARAQVFRVLQYLVAVVLLGYLVHQFGRLRASARDLRRANVDLQREILQREAAAAALQASEERFRAITESANDAIVSADRAGRIVSWNAGAEAIFGYSPAEAIGAPLAQLVPPRDHAAHRARFARWASTGESGVANGTVEIAGLRKDGSEVPLEISVATWSTAEGTYVTAIARDLTARKQLEETTRQQELQLIQASKMTALGTLVSGVGHEINNPNQLVLMNTRILDEAWDDAIRVLDAHRDESGDFALAGLPYTEMRDAVPALVRDIRDGALRIQRIVGDLKDFARPSASGDRTVVQLNDAVCRALRLLAHPVASRTTRFDVQLAPQLPTVAGDPQQVEQVVVNLVMNALEALPDRSRAVRVATDLDPGGWGVVLEVHDEGVGIPPEHLARLCDPFFTTKREHGGTGLGLAITSSLVRAHGGQISFSSEPGKGTRACVRFPLAEAA